MHHLDRPAESITLLGYWLDNIHVMLHIGYSRKRIIYQKRDNTTIYISFIFILIQNFLNKKLKIRGLFSVAKASLHSQISVSLSSVCPQNPFSSFHLLTFILHPSSFLHLSSFILHFATFELFRLFKLLYLKLFNLIS